MNPLYPHEITRGVAEISPAGLVTMSGTTLTAILDPLDVARDWTLTITLADMEPLTEVISIGFQGHVWNPTGELSGQSHTWTVDHNLAYQLEITGARQGSTFTADIACATPGEGPGRLALLAYTPRRDYMSAILGQAILGAFTLPKLDKPRPWFTLGQTALGFGTLPQGSTFMAWYSFVGPATTAQTTRGVNWNGFTTSGEIGTATVSFLNANDPRSSNLTRNTPIILLDCATRTPIFTGVIDRVSSTQEKTGDYRVTITAIDKIGEMARTTKYQETRNGQPAYWTLALDQLLADVPHTITTRDHDAQLPTIGDMVKEATLVAWTDIYCQTVAAHWFTDRRNQIQICDVPRTTPIAGITAHGTPPDLPALHATDVSADWDTSDLSATLEATNNHASYDAERGEWTGSTVTMRATNSTIEATYGPSTTTIETAAHNDEAMKDLITARVRNYTPHQVMNVAQFRPWDTLKNQRDDAQITALARLELLDPIAATYRAETSTIHVTGISHTITPTEWATSLTLAALRKE